ncbi:conserved Plasmodium protein, unknown function [Plasmodium ovale curtisi]|uniref:Uncharacterized protein n=1 Tax=Plasmodium ovale curtisi TaxID=864141 RepID=A0A1A8WQC7_PLAOA|nr:conserved Plasmodium protein, unknown function [Plasmodium ovale curtisi]
MENVHREEGEGEFVSIDRIMSKYDLLMNNAIKKDEIKKMIKRFIFQYNSIDECEKKLVNILNNCENYNCRKFQKNYLFITSIIKEICHTELVPIIYNEILKEKNEEDENFYISRNNYILTENKTEQEEHFKNTCKTVYKKYILIFIKILYYYSNLSINLHTNLINSLTYICIMISRYDSFNSPNEKFSELIYRIFWNYFSKNFDIINENYFANDVEDDSSSSHYSELLNDDISFVQDNNTQLHFNEKGTSSSDKTTVTDKDNNGEKRKKKKEKKIKEKSKDTKSEKGVITSVRTNLKKNDEPIFDNSSALSEKGEEKGREKEKNDTINECSIGNPDNVDKQNAPCSQDRGKNLRKNRSSVKTNKRILVEDIDKEKKKMKKENSQEEKRDTSANENIGVAENVEEKVLMSKRMEKGFANDSCNWEIHGVGYNRDTMKIQEKDEEKGDEKRNEQGEKSSNVTSRLDIKGEKVIFVNILLNIYINLFNVKKKKRFVFYHDNEIPYNEFLLHNIEIIFGQIKSMINKVKNCLNESLVYFLRLYFLLLFFINKLAENYLKDNFIDHSDKKKKKLHDMLQKRESKNNNNSHVEYTENNFSNSNESNFFSLNRAKEWTENNTTRIHSFFNTSMISNNDKCSSISSSARGNALFQGNVYWDAYKDGVYDGTCNNAHQENVPRENSIFHDKNGFLHNDANSTLSSNAGTDKQNPVQSITGSMASCSVINRNGDDHFCLINDNANDEAANVSRDFSRNVIADGSANGFIGSSANGFIDSSANGFIDSSANDVIDSIANGAIDNSAKGAIDNCANGAIDNSANGSIDNSANGAIDNSANGAIDNSKNAVIDNSLHDVTDSSAKDCMYNRYGSANNEQSSFVSNHSGTSSKPCMQSIAYNYAMSNNEWNNADNEFGNTFFTVNFNRNVDSYTGSNGTSVNVAKMNSFVHSGNGHSNGGSSGYWESGHGESGHGESGHGESVLSSMAHASKDDFEICHEDGYILNSDYMNRTLRKTNYEVVVDILNNLYSSNLLEILDALLKCVENNFKDENIVVVNKIFACMLKSIQYCNEFNKYKIYMFILSKIDRFVKSKRYEECNSTLNNYNCYFLLNLIYNLFKSKKKKKNIWYLLFGIHTNKIKRKINMKRKMNMRIKGSTLRYEDGGLSSGMNGGMSSNSEQGSTKKRRDINTKMVISSLIKSNEKGKLAKFDSEKSTNSMNASYDHGQSGSGSGSGKCNGNGRSGSDSGIGNWHNGNLEKENDFMTVCDGKNFLLNNIINFLLECCITKGCIIRYMSLKIFYLMTIQLIEFIRNKSLQYEEKLLKNYIMKSIYQNFFICIFNTLKEPETNICIYIKFRNLCINLLYICSKILPSAFLNEFYDKVICSNLFYMDHFYKNKEYHISDERGAHLDDNTLKRVYSLFLTNSKDLYLFSLMMLYRKCRNIVKFKILKNILKISSEEITVVLDNLIARHEETQGEKQEEKEREKQEEKQSDKQGENQSEKQEENQSEKQEENQSEKQGEMQENESELVLASKAGDSVSGMSDKMGDIASSKPSDSINNKGGECANGKSNSFKKKRENNKVEHFRVKNINVSNFFTNDVIVKHTINDQSEEQRKEAVYKNFYFINIFYFGELKKLTYYDNNFIYYIFNCIFCFLNIYVNRFAFCFYFIKSESNYLSSYFYSDYTYSNNVIKKNDNEEKTDMKEQKYIQEFILEFLSLLKNYLQVVTLIEDHLININIETLLKKKIKGKELMNMKNFKNLVIMELQKFYFIFIKLLKILFLLNRINGYSITPFEFFFFKLIQLLDNELIDINTKKLSLKFLKYFSYKKKFKDTILSRINHFHTKMKGRKKKISEIFSKKESKNQESVICQVKKGDTCGRDGKGDTNENFQKKEVEKESIPYAEKQRDENPQPEGQPGQLWDAQLVTKEEEKKGESRKRTNNKSRKNGSSVKKVESCGSKEKELTSSHFVEGESDITSRKQTDGKVQMVEKKQKKGSSSKDKTAKNEKVNPGGGLVKEEKNKEKKEKNNLCDNQEMKKDSIEKEKRGSKRKNVCSKKEEIQNGDICNDNDKGEEKHNLLKISKKEDLAKPDKEEENGSIPTEGNTTEITRRSRYGRKSGVNTKEKNFSILIEEEHEQKRKNRRTSRSRTSAKSDPKKGKSNSSKRGQPNCEADYTFSGTADDTSHVAEDCTGFSGECNMTGENEVSVKREAVARLNGEAFARLDGEAAVDVKVSSSGISTLIKTEEEEKWKEGNEKCGNVKIGAVCNSNISNEVDKLNLGRKCTNVSSYKDYKLEKSFYESIELFLLSIFIFEKSTKLRNTPIFLDYYDKIRELVEFCKLFHVEKGIDKIVKYLFYYLGKVKNNKKKKNGYRKNKHNSLKNSHRKTKDKQEHRTEGDDKMGEKVTLRSAKGTIKRGNDVIYFKNNLPAHVNDLDGGTKKARCRRKSGKNDLEKKDPEKVVSSKKAENRSGESKNAKVRRSTKKSDIAPGVTGESKVTVVPILQVAKSAEYANAAKNVSGVRDVSAVNSAIITCTTNHASARRSSTDYKGLSPWEQSKVREYFFGGVSKSEERQLRDNLLLNVINLYINFMCSFYFYYLTLYEDNYIILRNIIFIGINRVLQKKRGNKKLSCFIFTKNKNTEKNINDNFKKFVVKYLINLIDESNWKNDNLSSKKKLCKNIKKVLSVKSFENLGDYNYFPSQLFYQNKMDRNIEKIFLVKKKKKFFITCSFNIKENLKKLNNISNNFSYKFIFTLLSEPIHFEKDNEFIINRKFKRDMKKDTNVSKYNLKKKLLNNTLLLEIIKHCFPRTDENSANSSDKRNDDKKVVETSHRMLRSKKAKLES